ncbi:MAG: hypothetical protein WC460_00590 [Patescibacteria group bacterium]
MDNLKDKQIKLDLIKELTWPDVFEIWRQNEDYPNSHWITHWQSRGFKSWEEWRQTYVQPLGLADLKWQLYNIPEPLIILPFCHGGPFRSWVELYYHGQTAPSFSSLAQDQKVEKNSGVQTMLKNFPVQTIISGVIVNGEIRIVEGMHRATALAVAAKNGIKLNSLVKMALAKHPEKNLPIVGRFQKD